MVVSFCEFLPHRPQSTLDVVPTHWNPSPCKASDRAEGGGAQEAGRVAPFEGEIPVALLQEEPHQSLAGALMPPWKELHRATQYFILIVQVKIEKVMMI